MFIAAGFPPEHAAPPAQPDEPQESAQRRTAGSNRQLAIGWVWSMPIQAIEQNAKIEQDAQNRRRAPRTRHDPGVPAKILRSVPRASTVAIQAVDGTIALYDIYVIKEGRRTWIGSRRTPEQCQEAFEAYFGLKSPRERAASNPIIRSLTPSKCEAPEHDKFDTVEGALDGCRKTTLCARQFRQRKTTMALEITVGPSQLALHQGSSVLITEDDGQIFWPSDKGLYFFDTRLISSWQLYANGVPFYEGGRERGPSGPAPQWGGG